jgi:hypothetical protein
MILGGHVCSLNFMELSMFIQDDLQNIKTAFDEWLPSLKFLIMFVGVVVGPLAIAVGGLDSNSLSVTGMVWSFVAIALLFFISLGVGFSRFRHETKVPSIRPK